MGTLHPNPLQVIGEGVIITELCSYPSLIFDDLTDFCKFRYIFCFKIVIKNDSRQSKI